MRCDRLERINGSKWRVHCTVVDQRLRLRTGDNIYVVDGSVMPTSASTHTMTPIMVAADYAVHRMLES